MPFNPNVNDILVIDDIAYSITEHPSAKGTPYGQTGRMATVYQLINAKQPDDVRALKVMKEKWRNPGLVSFSQQLAAFAGLPGLQVCQRKVLTARQHKLLLRQNADLLYAVLMTWINGETWMDMLQSEIVLNQMQCLNLGRAFLDILVNMEEKNLAHGDLSAPNIIINSSTKNAWSVSLVDVEQFYAPGLIRPTMISAGSAGYAHRTAPEGLWGPQTDRFSGAILLAEMLGFHDAHVRSLVCGESYFEPEEIQTDSKRFQTLYSSLQSNWGNIIASLFERAWNSTTLSECPTFGEWLVSLPEKVPDSVLLKRPADSSEDESFRALIDLADRLEKQKNYTGALIAYQNILERAPNNRKAWVNKKIIDLQNYNKNERSLKTKASTPDRRIAKRNSSKSAGVLHSVDQKAPAVNNFEKVQKRTPMATKPANLDKPKERWKPYIPTFNRNKAIEEMVNLIVIFSVILIIIIALFQNTIAPLFLSIISGPFYYYFISLANGLFMAGLVGLVQLWIFRKRVASDHRGSFFIAVIAGGFLGATIGYILLGHQNPSVGVIVGAVGGFVSSLWQARQLFTRNNRYDWIIWNTFSWGAGWLLGYLIGAWLGPALAVGVIIFTSGISTGLFLKLNPSTEF